MTRRAQRHIWLVMANDFPEYCFASEALADDFCMEANARDREGRGVRNGIASALLDEQSRARVYYKWYKMEVLA